MMRRLLFAVGAVVALGLIHHTASAEATLKHINGQCGIHRGSKVIPFNTRYHVRIGVRTGTTGGSHRCLGAFVPKGTVWSTYGATGRCCSFPWKSFDFTRWNWKGILDVGSAVGFTAVNCGIFAAAFAGEFPTAGLDTIATAAAGGACAGGGLLIQNRVDAEFYPRR